MMGWWREQRRIRAVGDVELGSDQESLGARGGGPGLVDAEHGECRVGLGRQARARVGWWAD
jgi:hypothetical protein